MRVVGIVGSEEAKFTPMTRAIAKATIMEIIALGGEVDRIVSGGCHLGGIDIWAEEIAELAGIPMSVHKPRNLRWSTGYKPRNLKIAEESTEVHCITVRTLPETYTGMRFESCYHCLKTGEPYKLHVKSGGCWTMIEARKMGKPGILHVV